MPFSRVAVLWLAQCAWVPIALAQPPWCATYTPGTEKRLIESDGRLPVGVAEYTETETKILYQSGTRTLEEQLSTVYFDPTGHVSHVRIAGDIDRKIVRDGEHVVRDGWQEISYLPDGGYIVDWGGMRTKVQIEAARNGEIIQTITSLMAQHPSQNPPSVHHFDSNCRLVFSQFPSGKTMRTQYFPLAGGKLRSDDAWEERIFDGEGRQLEWIIKNRDGSPSMRTLYEYRLDDRGNVLSITKTSFSFQEGSIQKVDETVTKRVYTYR